MILPVGLLAIAAVGQIYVARRWSSALRAGWRGRAAEYLFWASIAASAVALAVANL